MGKIFISYNHKDEVLVDMIARRLEVEFGRNNIFYDKWSMQPGDSIIGRMNEGLSEFNTFFFVVSPNSIASNMVKLEWQSALNRAVNNNLKFVGVRIADCTVPAIIADKLYIDLYGIGLDDAVEKMKCVVKGENTYKPLEEVENLKATVKILDIKNNEITIKATMFADPIMTFAVGLDLPFDSFSLECITEPVPITGIDVIKIDDGTEFYARTITLLRPIRPGFPLKINLKCLSQPHDACIFGQINNNENSRTYKIINTTLVDKESSI